MSILLGKEMEEYYQLGDCHWEAVYFYIAQMGIMKHERLKSELNPIEGV